MTCGEKLWLYLNHYTNIHIVCMSNPRLLRKQAKMGYDPIIEVNPLSNPFYSRSCMSICPLERIFSQCSDQRTLLPAHQGEHASLQMFCKPNVASVNLDAQIYEAKEMNEWQIYIDVRKFHNLLLELNRLFVHQTTLRKLCNRVSPRKGSLFVWG